MTNNCFFCRLSAASVYNKTTMATLETMIAVPLTVTEYGTIRVGDSRVSLDSVVHHYKLGATAEQIAYSFPSLRLAHIHLAIAYYLTHREAIDAYLQQQETEADTLREKIEADPVRRGEMIELRERIQARWAARHETN
jgi:uncharacterized protein (DUF433 family)